VKNSRPTRAGWLAKNKSLCAAIASRKERQVLRLRLGKASPTKGIRRLASAQDDSTPHSVIPSEGEPPRTGLSQEQPQPRDLAVSSPRKNGAGKFQALSRATRGSPLQNSAILRVARKLERQRAKAQPPRIDSFLDFLTHHARVKCGPGYIPYHFQGREALLPIVQQLDAILASGQTDASLALCGGAQFGKTVLMLNLLAYLVAVRFRNVGYYLPDDDLVSGLVDGKLRPDVLDQIPWLARLLTVGKTLAPSGRAVNRKGAFLCTDGERSALAFMRGLGKIPTSFSMDVVIQDEKDDLAERFMRRDGLRRGRS
jgi:hypothetical protein